MKLPAISLKAPVTLVAKHGVLIALLVGILFDGWLIWQGWEQWMELPLPPDRVIAKQLRVNEAPRQALIDSITTYQHPAAVMSVPTTKFEAPTPTAN